MKIVECPVCKGSRKRFDTAKHCWSHKECTACEGMGTMETTDEAYLKRQRLMGLPVHEYEPCERYGRGRSWSQAEILIVQNNPDAVGHELARIMQEAGYARTVNACNQARFRYRLDREHSKEVY